MRSGLILCLLLCFTRQGHGNFVDFMTNLPGDVALAFTSTWDSVVEVIKRPVRTKQIGPASRKKALKVMTTTTYLWTSAPDTDKILDDLERKTAEAEMATKDQNSNKLELPLILLPPSSPGNTWMKRPLSDEFIRKTTKKSESTTVNTLKFYKENDAEDGSLGHDESYIFRPMILL